MLRGGVLHASDDFLGYDEDVRRGLGLDVAESQTVGVLIDDVGGNFAAMMILLKIVSTLIGLSRMA